MFENEEEKSRMISFKGKGCFCSIHCIDGSCPVAQYEERVELCMDVIYNCKDCWYNTRICEDCIFEGDSNVCPELGGDFLD